MPHPVVTIANTPPVGLSLPSVDESFLSQGNVFVMGPETLGSDETTGTWPMEVLDPLNQEPPLEFILIKPGDYAARTPNTYGLAPVSGGTQSNPVHYIGVINTNAQDLGELPVPWERDAAAKVEVGGFAIIGSGTVFGAYDADHVRVVGLSFDKTVNLVGTSSSIVKWCHSTSQTTGIRLRHGTAGNTISECLLRRDVPFDTTDDVVGVLLSDEVNPNNRVEYCTVIDYTDGIQTQNREKVNGENLAGRSDEYGYALGLTVFGNFMGFSDDVRSDSGAKNIEGCEQAGWDFKTGGTEAAPMRFTHNTVFGSRPNDRTPGYACVFHNVATWLECDCNRFIDNECIVALKALTQNMDPAAAWVATNLKFRKNLISGTVSHGADIWAGYQGRVRSLSHTMEFSANVIIDTDAWAERGTNAAAETVQPSLTVGNDTADEVAFGQQYSDQADWISARNRVISSEAKKQRTAGVPMTDISLTYWEPLIGGPWNG